MNKKIGIKIHNRFDFFATNINTVVRKKVGYAENVVLNKMYENLINLPYRIAGTNYNWYTWPEFFEYIHFGTGTGVPAATDTALFNKLGHANVTTELASFDEATNTVTLIRKALIGPQEFIGSIITEVGIAKDATWLNTHAMIVDAEGAALSITKLADTVIEIYATLYFILDLPTNVYLTDYNENCLLKYFMYIPKHRASSSPTYGIYGLASSIIMATDNHIKAPVGGTERTDNRYSLTVSPTKDVPNKRLTYKLPLDVNMHNNKNISEFYLDNVFTCKLPINTEAAYHSVEREIGVGDGETTRFKVNNRISDLVVKVDDVATSAYTTELVDRILDLSTPQKAEGSTLEVYSKNMKPLGTSNNEYLFNDYDHAYTTYNRAFTAIKNDNGILTCVALESRDEYVPADTNAYCRAVGNVYFVSYVYLSICYLDTYFIDTSNDTVTLALRSTQAVPRVLTNYTVRESDYAVFECYNQSYIAPWMYNGSIYVMGTAVNVDQSHAYLYSTPAVSSNGNYLYGFLNQNYSGYFLYPFVMSIAEDGTLVKLPNTGYPRTSYTSLDSSTLINSSGIAFLMPYSTSFAGMLIRFDGNTITEVPNISLGSNNAVASISPDGKFVAVAGVTNFTGIRYYEITPTDVEGPYLLENITTLVSKLHIGNNLEVYYADGSAIHGFRKKVKDQTWIEFTTAPAIGEVIKASYKVPYIEKTEDFTVDATLGLQFGAVVEE